MSDELDVRRFVPADETEVWRVHEAALRASPIEFIEDAPDDDLVDVPGRYFDDGGEFLVGLVDGTVVAIGGCQPQSPETVEIRRMRVHPDYQRKGHGRRLLDALEASARAAGYTTAVLYTLAQLTAARALYEAHGYTETHRETHPATGDTTVHYEKRLTTDAHDHDESSSP